MLAPAKPTDENARLETLRSLKILDTSPEERFDRLTRLARRLFGVPIVLISLVDDERQWFKSIVGLDATETPRNISFCGHAILGDTTFLVPDATQDIRFADNPLVTGAPLIRFYAGCPLSVPNGSKLGTLCLIDQEPRTLTTDDQSLLADLARMAEQEIAAVQLATMDEMTLLSNRRGFMALAQHALKLCERQQRAASLLFFDLNRFKQINDQFGHAEGDRALVKFAGCLRSAFRGSDVIGRLGGDEFVVLLTNAGSGETEGSLERLRTAVDSENLAAKRGYDIEFSVGATAYDTLKHESIESLLHEADGLMYENKRARKEQERSVHAAHESAT